MNPARASTTGYRGKRPRALCWIPDRLPVALLASALDSRLQCAALVAAALLLAAGYVSGLEHLWRCPLRVLTGLPCPACGLTGAAVALVHLDPLTATARHPFIWFVAAAWLAMAARTILPEHHARRLIGTIEWLELKTGLSLAVFAAFGLHGLIRAALSGSAL